MKKLKLMIFIYFLYLHGDEELSNYILNKLKNNDYIKINLQALRNEVSLFDELALVNGHTVLYGSHFTNFIDRKNTENSVFRSIYSNLVLSENSVINLFTKLTNTSFNK